MMRFEREFSYWPCAHEERLNIVKIESKGRDLDDLLANAEIYIEDWHGNEGPVITVEKLASSDFDYVIALFSEFLSVRESFH